MRLTIQRYEEEKHYSELLKVWARYGWIPCPAEDLPATGVVAVGPDGTFVAALFMYVAEEKIGYIEWAVAARDVTKETRAAAWGPLFAILRENARERGIKYLYAVTKVARFREILESCGMSVAEEHAASLIMSLNGDDSTYLMDY
jgi:hypothetical protein